MEVLNVRAEAFRNWLQGKISSRPISDCISRCRIIEDCLKFDLDEEYGKVEEIVLLLYYNIHQMMKDLIKQPLKE